MVQYIAVSGGACDVLSIFRQFAGEISFIKITENDNERVRVMLLCVCDLSGMALFSQVSVKQSAAEFKKSLFVRVRSCSSSDLFARERRFARWILSSAVEISRAHQRTSLACVAWSACIGTQHLWLKCSVKRLNVQTSAKGYLVCYFLCPRVCF